MEQPVQREFEIISGSGNVLLVAPHGVLGDDDNTGTLARKLAEQLNCHAIINEVYRKPDKDSGEPHDIDKKIVNLNDLRQYRKTPLEKQFLGPINDAVNATQKKYKTTYIFHIHGIDDGKIENNVVSTQVVLGIGLASTKPGKDSLSIPKKIATELETAISKSGITASITNHPDYTAIAPHNLNQLFQKQVPKINSVQVEFKKSGIRDTDDNIAVAAELIAQAIRKLPNVKVSQPVPAKVEEKRDDALAQKAFDTLKDIFIQHYENARNKAMLDAGRYIIKTFYDDDYQLAKDKNQAAKKKSLNRLIKMLQENASDAPNKTWVYDAVALAVDEHQLESFQTYGKISVSHKLRLLTVKDIEIKKKLIKETVKGPLSVRQLAVRVKEEIGEEPGLLDLISHPGKLFSGDNTKYYSDETLEALGPEERSAIREDINKQAEKLRGYLIQFEDLLKKLGNQ